MTQLTVSIENPDMLRDIKKAIMMIRGVVSVKAEKPKPNAATVAAIDAARKGETIHCGSFENYKKMVANLDDV
ncbi:hypothetical protein [uncultured Duncaniella sp.]|uniref:hypothetical protein n=1 Tax=uncultured Duncaniella sp. TaxID=2768039 RepID=UPI0025CFDACC|nr:hypothetical protein [uncultured Duncaniella sp.]